MMQMYAYYITKGSNLKELINMPYIDKLFYYAAMQKEKEDKVKFYVQLFGGGK